jgi:hypothetical protein
MNLYLTKEQLDAVVLAIDYYTEENDSHFIENKRQPISCCLIYGAI